MTDIKKGDRVKVTIEGYWTHTGEVDGKGFHLYDNVLSQATIEKIEPPVEVFKPGDVVRSKGKADPDLRVITRGGWVNLRTGSHYVDGATKPRFTSENYERVNIE